jgi:Na+/melibiose symporter-like transporter
MLNMSFFRNPRFSSGTGTLVVASLALAGLTFTLIQYLQVVREYTPFEAGVRMVPLALGFALGARGSSVLVARLGTKKMAAGGLLVVAASLIGFSFLDGDTAYWIVGIFLAIMGVGLGSSIAPTTDAVMGAVPEANAGVGSAVNDTARQVGYALGVGVVASVLNTVYSSNIHDGIAGLPAEAYNLAHNSVGGAAQVAASMGNPLGDGLRIAANTAFVDAFGVVMIIGASIAFIGALLVLWFMPARDLSVGG